jgi:RHS repeat-associated protein
LNLPTKIAFTTKAADSRIENAYTAAGTKIKETVYTAGILTHTTDYSGAFVYKDNWLAYILTPEGRIVIPQPTGGAASGKALTAASYYYEYQLKDHLGNVRVTFTDKDKNGIPEVQSENHYYPFGMPIGALTYMTGVPANPTFKDFGNEFFYNGKEAVDNFGLGWLDYGWRQFDPIICRWWSVDPLAEKYRRWSPYNYCVNNPLRFIDPDGMTIVVTVQETDQERKPELETKYKQTVSDAFKGKVSADIDKNGKVSFAVNKKDNGKEVHLNGTQKAAFNILNGIANDQDNTVTQTLMDSNSKGAAGVDVGSWTTGAIDLDDIAAYGTDDDRMTTKGKLVHETYEQQQKEIAKKNGEDVNSKEIFLKSHNSALLMENQCQYFERTKDVFGSQYGIYNGIEYIVTVPLQGKQPEYKPRP